jgi:hypothetical protein
MDVAGKTWMCATSMPTFMAWIKILGEDFACKVGHGML